MQTDSDQTKMMRSDYRVLLLFVLSLIANDSGAASFNCDKATSATEKAICADPTLSRLDETMAVRYKSLLVQLPSAQVETLKQEQRGWLQQRNRCADQVDCLKRQYAGRLVRLEQLAAPTPAAGTTSPAAPAPATTKDNNRLPVVVYDWQQRQWLKQGVICQSCTPRNGFPNPPLRRQGFYFHPSEGGWYDDDGPCHTCTPENGFTAPP